MPFSPWPKDQKLKKIGVWQRENMQNVRGISWRMLTAAGMPSEEIDTLVAEFKAELQNPNCWPYTNMYVVAPQIPE